MDSVIKALQLPNAEITPRRAEELDADLITARALAPIPKALALFRPALKKGARLLLYKGPDAEQEIAEAGKTPYRMEIIMRYDLPDNLGTRTIVQITSQTKRG